MPQQIDPNTGRPIGFGAGDGVALPPPPDTIPGFPGLRPAHRVDEGYTLRPFESFINQGGQRYVQNVLSNPYEVPGYQPPAAPLPPPGMPVDPGAPSVNLPPGSPMTGGAEPYPGALPPPQTNMGTTGANPWASFFQGLSRTQGPSQSGTWGQTRNLQATAGAPQSWQQSARGFRPGGSMSPGASRSPFARMFNPAVMPQTPQMPLRPPGQMSTPEPPLANAGYFPGPSLPPPPPPQMMQAPSWQQQFNGGPG